MSIIPVSKLSPDDLFRLGNNITHPRHRRRSRLVHHDRLVQKQHRQDAAGDDCRRMSLPPVHTTRLSHSR